MAIFPNVPDLPGVPAIPRLPGAAGALLDVLVADVAGALGFFSQPQWGLFLDGEAVVAADSVVAFSYAEDWQILDAQVEDGLFETFNKVQKPYDVRLRFAVGGGMTDRQALIQSVAAIMGSTDLFDAVTPEQVYTGVNPIHQDYRRTSNSGVGLLQIDLFCRQVLVSASTSFSSTATTPTANGAQSNNGIVQQPNGSSQSFAQINQPQAVSAAPQVNVGTVQASAPQGGQFDLSQALP